MHQTNSILTVQLAIGCPVQVKPGAMIAMSPTVTMKGEVKFSMKKFIGGAQMAVSTFTGPGELLLAPAFIGDIIALPLNGSEVWTVGKDAFLACTERVHKELKTQKFSQAMFSGEGLFTYKMSGTGVLWIDSLGAGSVVLAVARGSRCCLVGLFAIMLAYVSMRRHVCESNSA